MKVLLHLAIAIFLLGMVAGNLPGNSEKPELSQEQLIQMGLLLHELGEYEKAATLFQRSLDIQPTAQGYTYLAWSLSYLGKLDQALALAKKAIELDPNFGNPYNDVGAYLIEKGEYDQAIPYLKQAMKAPNYCCYFFPHFNLGRIYLFKGQYSGALAEFEEALKLEPNYLPALLAIEYVKKKMQEGL